MPWILAGLVFCISGVAGADDIADNARLLRTAEDVRVRTQAALALGASRDKKAVVPLCQGVRDPHRVVRIASATALARLSSGGEACIKQQLQSESDAKVKAALQKTLRKLESGGDAGGAEPQIGGATKFYVALDALGGPERFKNGVRSALVRGVSGKSDVAIAPSGETASEAAGALTKYPAARGFQLSPKVTKPVYADGTLTIKLSVAILSYPDKAILGSFSQTVGMGGVTEPDPKAEEELLLAAAESAMKKFLQIAPTLQ